MDRTGSMARLTESLARAQAQWHSARDTNAGMAMTIALNREAGTHGTAVAHVVGERLGWSVYDHELMEHIAREKGLRVDLLESLDEKPQSWFLECIQAFVGDSLGEAGYVSHLVETIVSLGRLGRCVIVGRGAANLLPRETTLRVRLVAPLADRIAAYAKNHTVPREEAARQVEKLDRQRTTFVQSHFHKDVADPHNYDLILNTARWSIEECADAIIDGLHRLERRPREQHVGRG
jgi:cytidylate kinase